MMKKASHAMARTRRPAFQPVGKAVAAVRRRIRAVPRLAMVLGSGFGGVLNEVQVKVKIPCSTLPGYPQPTVSGHAGGVICGTLGRTEVILLAGRAHYYEGHDMDAVTFSVRMLAGLGVEAVVLTNAAGGLNRKFKVGDFMMLTDHINLMGINPLRGTMSGDDSGFVDMTQAYDIELQLLLQRAARRTRIGLRGGVYLAVGGPSYETPAEIRAFRRLGADAIGMSTVPEVIVARREGLRVAAVSCITNMAAGISSATLSHVEVLETGRRTSQQAGRLLKQFVRLYATD